jgi:hypothetical protein
MDGQIAAPASLMSWCVAQLDWLLGSSTHFISDPKLPNLRYLLSKPARAPTLAGSWG